jgi:ABC-type dipeptide/oligopeptide/nickel transport system ATPase component
MAMILITHDRRRRRRTDEVAVVYAGRVVERAPTVQNANAYAGTGTLADASPTRRCRRFQASARSTGRCEMPFSPRCRWR